MKNLFTILSLFFIFINFPLFSQEQYKTDFSQEIAQLSFGINNFEDIRYGTDNNIKQSKIINYKLVNTEPSFNPIGPFCVNGPSYTLPTTSTNGISGTWDNPIVNTSVSGTTYYRFTPNASEYNFVDIPIIINPLPVISIINHSGTTILTCSDSILNFTATGGVSYMWNNNRGVQGESTEVSATGSYTVTVTDNNGCTATNTIKIDQNTTPPIPQISNISNTDTLTCDLPTILLRASGGNSYSWDLGPSTQEYNVTTPGNHKVTVTAANGCTDIASYNIYSDLTQPNVSIINNTGSTILDCNNSSINVSATGGVSLQWDNGITSADNTFTTPGTYTVTATATNGCTNSASITISQPDSLRANITATEILCYGRTSTVTINAYGGTPPYQGIGNINNVPAGIHLYTITDANGCSYSASIEIPQPDQLQIAFEIIDQNPCYGDSEASAIASVTGGTGDYTYGWNDQLNTTTPQIDNLPAGNWTLQITDENNCIYTETLVITQPAPLLPIIGVQHVWCYGGQDGEIRLVNDTIGGTPPYRINVNGDVRNFPIVADIGTYLISIRDTNNCPFDTIINIIEPLPINIELTTTLVVCGQNAGSINTTVTGGTPDYIYYEWSNGELTKDITNLPTGTYTVTVTDNNGCTSAKTANISSLNDLDVDINEIFSIRCAEDQNGVLNATTNSTGAIRTYWWSNGATTESIENLFAGTYRVTVTDVWGCSGTKTHILTEPTKIKVTSIVQNNKCHGESIGSISLNVSEGIPPYTINWSILKTEAEIRNLPAGNYSVTITDDNDCKNSLEFLITEPDSLILKYNIKDASCFENSDGSIIINGEGGTQPYTTSVNKASNGLSQTNFNTLKADKYFVILEDGNKCKISEEFTINQPLKLEALHNATDPSCIKYNDGKIEINAYGGTFPYVYKVNNMTHNENIISELREGAYSIEVIDFNNCKYIFKKIVLTDTYEDCLKIIPTAFTPNGDGINDTWIIDGIEKFPDASIYIFNRWGQVLYEGRGYDDPWDGKYKSKVMPAGTYIYIIMPHNQHEGYKGTLTIVY